MTATGTAPLVPHDVRPREEPARRSAEARRVDAEGTLPDIVDVWGNDSFPASDAPANW